MIFTTTDVNALYARLETIPIGRFLVTTPEQTLIDLVAKPGLGGMPEEARDDATALAATVDRDRVTALVAVRPKTVQQRVRYLLDQVPEHPQPASARPLPT